jgi:ABC-type sugar transport system ATPase subunit
MDEPLSSLDLELNIRLRKEIFRLQERLGFTMLYVTRDRDEAFDMATRVVFMKQGRIDHVGAITSRPGRIACSWPAAALAAQRD